ncbi:MAG: aldo/keto reductase [Anaerolineales bacterium]
MTNKPDLPLVLGGHSFIQQLGNDPRPSPAEQVALVAACLDHGLCWFDTTYQPERVALGQALAALGRRPAATILAWNFFVDFDDVGRVGGPAYYQPHHIEQMLEQLQTSWIDGLVVHNLADPDENQRQLALAHTWQARGYVRRIGLWHPPANAAQAYAGSAISFMVSPYNSTTPEAGQIFAASRALGWENLACSPFVRGWELDKLAERAQQAHGISAPAARRQAADILLRYALYQPNVDRLIVSIRRLEWIEQNIASVQRGPLVPAELAWLGLESPAADPPAPLTPSG